MNDRAFGSIVAGWMLSSILGLSTIAWAQEAATPATTWVFETVWYRGEKKPSLIKAYAASGTLTVGDSALAYRSGKADLDVPLVAIRDVSLGRMKGDPYNDWAIVQYEEEGSSRTIGFRDGKGLGHGPNTVAIHDAIRRALAAGSPTAGASSAGASTDTSSGVASSSSEVRLSWKEFNQQVQHGFPPAPSILVTDPKTTGLLVVDGEVKSGLHAFDMNGVGLVRVGEEGVLRGGPAGGLPGGCVLFTGLEPGDYFVKLARGSSAQGWAALEAPDSPDLHVRIESGKLHYLGHLRMKSKGRNTVVEVERDPSREAKVWARFAQKYPGTAWAVLAEERSGALQVK